MAQPMLAIIADTPDEPVARVTPNLLPCRIHHSGPVGATESFWAPKETDGKQTAYFRGRKLHGQAVPLPTGYHGVVAERRESPREQARQSNALAADEIVDVDATVAEQAAQRQRLDTGALETVAAFDGLTVWGHQSTADAGTDAYVRSMEEWVALAEKIHSYEA